MSRKQGPHAVGMRPAATSPKGAGRREAAVQSVARDGLQARNAAGLRQEAVSLFNSLIEEAV